jgi:hypothetical protein
VIPSWCSTYSMFDSKCSGFDLITTKMRIGKKESALSSECRCRISPECTTSACQPGHVAEKQTKDDLAAVEYTDELVSRGFVIVDL